MMSQQLIPCYARGRLRLRRKRTQHVTRSAHGDKKPSVGPEFLAQAMDVNVECSVLRIELALEHLEDQLLASDDRCPQLQSAEKGSRIRLSSAAGTLPSIDIRLAAGSRTTRVIGFTYALPFHGPPGRRRRAVFTSHAGWRAIIANLLSLRC